MKGASPLTPTNSRSGLVVGRTGASPVPTIHRLVWQTTQWHLRCIVGTGLAPVLLPRNKLAPIMLLFDFQAK